MKTPYRTNAPPSKYVDELPPRQRRAGLAWVVFWLAMLVSGLFIGSGCAWFQKNESYFPTPADVSCVYGAVESGVQDPAGIVAACPALAALAIEDLLRLISGLVLGKAHRIEMEKAKAAVSVSGPPVHAQVVPADAGPPLYKYSDGGTK